MASVSPAGATMVPIRQPVMLKVFDAPDENGAGTVTNVRGASDHLPVWAIAILPY